MFKKLFLLICFVLVLALAGNALANFWDGGAGAGNPYWDVATNWQTDTVPTSTDDVEAIKVGIDYGPTIANPGAVGLNVYVGTWGWPGELTVTSSGSLSVINSLVIGNGADDTGEVINEGNINVNGSVYVGLLGDGELNMNSGTIDIVGNLDIATQSGATGHANFHGGTVTAGGLLILDDGTCTADFTTGVLIAGGDHTAIINSMASAGLITGYGGAGTVNATFDGVNTTVWASANKHWDGGAGVGTPYWNLAANWSTDTVPTSADNAIAIKVPGYGPTVANPGATAANVYVGVWGWPGELTVTSSGSLSVEDSIIVGYGATPDESGVIVNEGSIDVGVDMTVGLYDNGELNMNGGEINITHNLYIAKESGSVGHVDLYDGTITTAMLDMDNSSATMEITDGTLLISTNQKDTIDDLVDAGRITAYSGAVVLSDWDITNPGYTTVWAHVPVCMHFDGGAGDGLWSTATNWSTDTVPTSVDTAMAIKLPGYGPTIDNMGAAAETVYVGVWNWPGELTLTSSGSFSVVNSLVIGSGATDTGVVFNEGSIDIGASMYVGLQGDGELNMNGGTIDVIGNLSIGVNAATGHANFYGGTVTAAGLLVQGDGTGTADFTESVLIFGGDQTGGINWMASMGWWTAYGGDGIVKTNYDTINPGCTSVWGVVSEPLPRIAAEADQPDPIFYNTQTTLEFTPLGSNYIRLDWIDNIGYHATFTTGLYDSVAAEAALTQMQQDGYNVVRVFVNAGDPAHQELGQYDMAGPFNTNTPELYQPCLDNLIDFLRRARSHNIYVILNCDQWPHNVYYNTLAYSNTPENVENVNVVTLAQGAIDTKKLYMTKLVEAVKNAEPDGAPLSTVFSWEITNEIFVDVEWKPFSMTTGTVTPADGLTYDMSIPSERQECMDNGILRWANQIVDAIKAVDPDSMVSLGVFTYKAVGKSGPNGVLPRDAADPRFPARPWSLLEFSMLSHVDVHLYPTGGGYSMDSDLASSEYSIWDFEAMPLLMGEFGAFKSYYPNIYNAANAMVAHRQNAFDRGFSGALYWTWDTYSQGNMWQLLSSGGVINNVLKPD